MPKRFLFVCLGLLALAVAYHLGASSAQSQVGGFVGLSYYTQGGYSGTEHFCALTADGSIYISAYDPNPGRAFPTWTYWGTIPTGGTAAQSSTWGQVKTQLGK